MSYVFISYSRKDREFADKISDDLRSAGIKIWRDIDKLNPGQDWSSSINDALKQVDALLFILSKHSIQSDWVMHEIYIAVERSVLVIPVIIDEVSAEHIPSVLYNIHWLDFRSDYQAALQKLLISLPATLREDQPIKSEEPRSKGYVFVSYVEEDTEFVLSLRGFLRDRGYGYWYSLPYTI